MAKKRTARIALALALIALWISALAIPVNAQSTGGQTVVEYSQLGDMTLSFEQPGDTYTLQIINDTQQPVALTGMDIPSQFDKYFQPLTLTWPQNLEPQQAFEIALVQTQKPVTRTAPIELVLHKQSGGQATIYLQMCSCHLVNEGLETTRVEIPAEDYDATSMLTLQADVRLEGDCIIDGHANQSIALRVCLAEQKEEPIEVQNAPDQPQTCYIQCPPPGSYSAQVYAYGAYCAPISAQSPLTVEKTYDALPSIQIPKLRQLQVSPQHFSKNDTLNIEAKVTDAGGLAISQATAYYVAAGSMPDTLGAFGGTAVLPINLQPVAGSAGVLRAQGTLQTLMGMQADLPDGEYTLAYISLMAKNQNTDQMLEIVYTQDETLTMQVQQSKAILLGEIASGASMTTSLQYAQDAVAVGPSGTPAAAEPQDGEGTRTGDDAQTILLAVVLAVAAIAICAAIFGLHRARHKA